MMPPQAVQDEVQYANTLEVIDRLMAVAKLTRGQALYLETLVVLVQAYIRKLVERFKVGPGLLLD